LFCPEKKVKGSITCSTQAPLPRRLPSNDRRGRKGEWFAFGSRGEKGGGGRGSWLSVSVGVKQNEVF